MKKAPREWQSRRKDDYGRWKTLISLLVKMGVLLTYSLGLSLNPPGLHLQSSWYYRREPLYLAKMPTFALVFKVAPEVQARAI
jgi:hypothetical protein